MALLGLLAGCGDAVPLAERQRAESRVEVRLDEGDDLDEPADTEAMAELEARLHPEPEPYVAPSAVADDFAVLFDDRWLVEEGVWDLAALDPEEQVPEVDGLLSTTPNQRAAGLFVPGMYGYYRVRVERHPARPRVPRWCEDVVEVSLRHDDAGLHMWSFESSADEWPVPRGPLRVRWCATGLDLAAQEDEFDGDDYHTYSGRHLIQVWGAPMSPRAEIRLGSEFARSVGR